MLDSALPEVAPRLALPLLEPGGLNLFLATPRLLVESGDCSVPLRFLSPLPLVEALSRALAPERVVALAEYLADREIAMYSYTRIRSNIQLRLLVLTLDR